MNEMMWQLVQIILWVFGVQTAVLIAILTGFHVSMNRKFDKIEGKFDKIEGKFDKIDARFDKIDARFDKLENRMNIIEHDMVQIKTILRLKECCMIKDDAQIKKAE